MIRSLSNRLMKFTAGSEARLGLAGASLLNGLLLLGCAMLYVEPSFETAYHGIQFAALSEHPFDFSVDTPVRYRILAPVLGYLLFLRGDLFFLLPLLFALLLPAAVYYSYRKKKYSPTEAFLFACFISFSCVILIPLVGPGYTDTVTCFFLFLTVAWIRKPLASAVFYSLALLNHESSLFLFPGIVAYAYAENSADKKSFLKNALFLALACLPALAYRLYVNAHVQVQYSASFYFSAENIRFTLKNLVVWLPGGMFYTFKLLWFFPLYFMYVAWRDKSWPRFAAVSLMLLGVFSQLLIAYDYTRMLITAFPAVLIAAGETRNRWGTERFVKFSLALILFNFLILQYYFSYDGPVPIFPWALNEISAVLGYPLN